MTTKDLEAGSLVKILYTFHDYVQSPAILLSDEGYTFWFFYENAVFQRTKLEAYYELI